MFGVVCVFPCAVYNLSFARILCLSVAVWMMRRRWKRKRRELDREREVALQRRPNPPRGNQVSLEKQRISKRL